jgi:hypothetical protein
MAGEYQVVVFVRVNDMASLEVVKQRTFVINQELEAVPSGVASDLSMDVRIAEALRIAHEQAVDGLDGD